MGPSWSRRGPAGGDVSLQFEFPLPPDIGASFTRAVGPGFPWTGGRRPGTYVVEYISGLAALWEITDVVCDDPGGTPSSGDVGARTATFGIDAGEHVTCTFTVSQGKVKVVVEMKPAGGDVSLDISIPFPPDFGGFESRFV